MTAFPQTNQNKIDRLDKPPAEKFLTVSAKFIAATHCKSRENPGPIVQRKNRGETLNIVNSYPLPSGGETKL